MTGLTPPEHMHSAQIELAGQWIAENRNTAPRPLYPSIREMFGLNTFEVLQAYSAAREIKRSMSSD